MTIRIEITRSGHPPTRGGGSLGRARKILLSLAVIGAVATAAGIGTYSAFTATTTSTGNTFAAGSVAIEDNDGGATAMLNLANAKPGDSDTSCIKVRYTGSLAASVRLLATTAGTLPEYLNLTVTRGTDASPAFDECGTFAADPTNYIGAGPGVVYSGTLASFPVAGIVDPTAGAPESWTTGEEHLYSFDVSLADDDAAKSQTGSAAFTWEARNQ